MPVFSDKRDAGKDAPPRGEPALTIIATGTKVQGEVASDGVVKVEGVVQGTVRAERQVLVARGGVIEGDVFTREAVLGGTVKGGVVADERVEVQSGAVVNGDIATERLIVQEGGEVNGQVRMGNPKDTAQRGQSPSGRLATAQAASG